MSTPVALTITPEDATGRLVLLATEPLLMTTKPVPWGGSPALAGAVSVPMAIAAGVADASPACGSVSVTLKAIGAGTGDPGSGAAVTTILLVSIPGRVDASSRSAVGGSKGGRPSSP